MKRAPILAVALVGVLAGAPAAHAENAATEVTTPASAPIEQPFGASDVNPDSEHPVAAGYLSLPSVASLGGQTYFLNADGGTYVSDVARVTVTPTEDEVKISRELVAQHSAELAQQALSEAKAGGTQEFAAPAPTTEAPAPTTEVAVAAAPRGMAAQTGDNSLARGLVAFVLASAAGAAVFFYGRRHLI
ncbi:hypothetical protein CAPI_08210 [Corynebacterium capitovis DSM 44611]|uniref:hypothetical protein n=1 Tax=Corynebacterium capitovis TaxID=131081 RepID=UPI000369B47B|nr:hypothetical protein [Corynebacterium capitovis]WKD58169.1 hypothetical protein CAPI_08210 [Corynebacterium capitovis DSM 44611]